MQKQPLFYHEDEPSRETAHFILSYWEFRVSDEPSAPLMHEVFPDGCISLVFYRNKFSGFCKLFVTSINPKSIYVPVSPGDTIWAMRVLPEACSAFVGINPAESANYAFQKEIMGERFSPILENHLIECQNFSEAIVVYNDYARDFGVQSTEVDARLAKATKIFIASEGTAKISETAREIGLGERQFERKYRRASGLTPKQFARICRFRATALDMLRNSRQNWANRAAEKGFTDQSHLNREFSNLTGNSPVNFAANVKRIRHGKILE